MPTSTAPVPARSPRRRPPRGPGLVRHADRRLRRRARLPTSRRSRRTCAPRPAATWTPGTTGCATPTWPRWPTSASPRPGRAGRSSPRWSGTSRSTRTLALVLSAIKATVKGGIGKLRERPPGRRHRPGEPWPALERPTWRPDIRAAVICRGPGQHAPQDAQDSRPPPACTRSRSSPTASSTSPTARARWTSCRTPPDGKPLPGGFRLGVTPGMVKHEGTQSVLWADRSPQDADGRQPRPPHQGRPTPPPTERRSSTMGDRSGDSLDKARGRAAFTRPIPKSAQAQMRYLVKQHKGTKAVAELLGDLPAHRRALPQGPAQAAPPGPRRPPRARGHASAGSRRSARRRRRQAATTGGIVIETRARFGFTAAPGTTDDARIRHITQALPPAYAARLFDARDAGRHRTAAPQIAAEGLGDLLPRQRPPRARPGRGVHRRGTARYRAVGAILHERRVPGCD